MWPDVVLNDAPLPCDPQTWLGGYDAVVVSPGPGTPERATDLGHSRAAVEQGEVPVLGVCLGHQAIGYAYGARVRRALRPVHGEVAEVEHEGSGLFAGLPNPLRMVRYHSLVVTDPPPHLVVDAVSPVSSVAPGPSAGEPLVMAMHHRDRPLWGVQTHPESIGSAHGRHLLANFLRMAREWNGSRRVRSDVQARRVVTRRVDLPGGTRDPEAVFDVLFRGDEHAWWLDSALSEPEGEGGGRFSFMGSAAGPLARVARTRATSDGTRVVLRDGLGEREHEGTVLDLLERDLAFSQVTVEVQNGDRPPFDFHLGWVGYLGYEAGTRALPDDARETRALAGLRDEDPEAVLVFADRAVVLDHREGVAWALALLPSEDGGPAGADGDADADDVDLRGDRDVRDVAARQRKWLRDTGAYLAGPGSKRCRAEPEPVPPPPHLDGIAVRHTHAAYLALVGRCLDHIAAGESYELCLTNRITVQARTDPWHLYRRLRATSPRPFAAYLAFGPTRLLSASPERFLRVVGGEVEAKPIKGTRPRGATPEEDAALAAELTSDPKELAENLMIVDLLRNDLGRVARVGSVHVPVLFDVETYAGVHQLVSTVRGRLADGMSAIDAVRAAFPGGSMTGAPKKRSVRILRDLESGPRGVYAGAIGYFSLSGAADWSIVIRSIVWHPDHLTYGVGGAVTARSDPEAEWQETLVKARTLGSALGVDVDAVLQPASGAPPGPAPGRAVGP